MATLKVKSWGEGQGDHVLIDEENFVDGVHELYEPEQPKAAKKPKAEKPEQPKS